MVVFFFFFFFFLLFLTNFGPESPNQKRVTTSQVNQKGGKISNRGETKPKKVYPKTQAVFIRKLS